MRRLFGFLILAIIFCTAAWGQTPPLAGTVISNQATASYVDPNGQTLNTKSDIVTVTISAVAGVQVTPDETTISATYGPLEDHERTFQICNSGNITNDFVITNVTTGAPATLRSLYYDTNNNGIYDTGDTAVTLNATATPIESGPPLPRQLPALR